MPKALTPEEVQQKIDELIPQGSYTDYSRRFCEQAYDAFVFTLFSKKEIKRAEVVSLMLKAYAEGAVQS